MCAGCVLQDQLIVCIISGKSYWTSAHLIITLKVSGSTVRTTCLIVGSDAVEHTPIALVTMDACELVYMDVIKFWAEPFALTHYSEPGIEGNRLPAFRPGQL